MAKRRKFTEAQERQLWDLLHGDRPYLSVPEPDPDLTNLINKAFESEAIKVDPELATGAEPGDNTIGEDRDKYEALAAIYEGVLEFLSSDDQSPSVRENLLAAQTLRDARIAFIDMMTEIWDGQFTKEQRDRRLRPQG